MTPKRETLAALARLKSGAVTLTSEQYSQLLEAVEQAFQALALAPRGGDPAATGVWYNHERTPALARLADALSPQPDAGAARELRDQQRSDHEVARELHRALVRRASR